MTTRKRKPTKKVKLSPKHTAFVEKYLENWNGTDAYMFVYSSKTRETASANAVKLLRKSSIQLYIAERVKERNDAITVDRQFVLDKALEIINSDYAGTIQKMTPEEFDKIPLAARKLINGYTVSTSQKKGLDGDLETIETYKVTFMSKDRAHEMVAKITGAYAPTEIRADINVKGFAALISELDEDGELD